MAKIYQGKVSVYSNSNKQLVVKPENETNCDTPLLMADRWGKPYIALLPERKAPGAVKVTVQKLA